MRFKIVVILLFALGLTSFSNVHKFYVSVTEIEYNPKAESLQIISKIDVDDLEKTFQQRYGKEIKLKKNKDGEKIEQYIAKYLQQKIEISVNGKAYSFKYLGKEYDLNTLIFYLEIPDVPEPKTISVKNLILTDMFPEQKNLVHVEYRGIKSMILTGDHDHETVKF